MEVAALVFMLKKITPKKLFRGVSFGVLYTFVSLVVIVLGTLIAIQYAKGGLRFTKTGGFQPETGLLNANSFPTGAEVYVDGELLTATDNTLYLPPGEYLVEIRKEGYSPWQKNLTIEKELVTQTNAQLFPSAPSLSPLTLSGASRIVTSPDGQKIVFYTNNAHSAENNGLYLLELSNNFIPLGRGPKLIAIDVPEYNLDQASLIWSPNSAELMILTDEKEMLIEVGSKIELTKMPDIAWKRAQVLSEWEEEIYQREREFLKDYPEEIVRIATSSAKNAYFSPDKKKLMYTATTTLILPDEIVPPLPSRSTQPETRTLGADQIYIYDTQDDRNFLIGKEASDRQVAKHLLATDLYGPGQTLESSPAAFTRLQAPTVAETARRFQVHHTPLYTTSLQWLPDSNHLINSLGEAIEIMEYDGGNRTVVYAGQFAENFFYPWPNGEKLIILTTFSPTAPANLYAIELKN
ncbi:MAG TPA: PEGA domain-containing protein [Patescibacteria group bacterium]